MQGLTYHRRGCQKLAHEKQAVLQQWHNSRAQKAGTMSALSSQRPKIKRAIDASTHVSLI